MAFLQFAEIVCKLLLQVLSYDIRLLATSLEVDLQMYSKDSLNIAKAIVSNKGNRKEFVKLLAEFDKPECYSNERFDQTQILAELLSKLASNVGK